MYSEWVSIPVSIQVEERRWSVLHKFPSTVGRDIVVAVMRSLPSTFGVSATNCEPSTLKTEKEVQWAMEVICFGLDLPLTEHEAIRDCVSIYCDWLSVLTNEPKACIPKPVLDDPNIYARKMIQHLYNLFVPRSESSDDTISRQAVLCHRVLRTLETLAHDSQILERETWDTILIFLLAINDTLLSPPTVQDDISSKLGERILGVLFKVWLLACHRCFPSPPLWKTFRELCCSWRHRVVLVDQWNKVNLALTSRVLQFLYGDHLPEVKLNETEQTLVPAEMVNYNIAQTWFRFLHTLGNPVYLSRPEVISQTPKFYHFALSSEMVIDPCQHPCLASLPQVFFKAMHGVSTLINSFLGLARAHSEESASQPTTIPAKVHPTTTGTIQSVSITPPHLRRNVIPKSSGPGKSQPRTSLIAGLTSRASSIPAPSNVQPVHHSQVQSVAHSPVNHTPSSYFVPGFQPCLSPSRPRCNSILHLFGSWLFEAALIGSGIVTRANSESGAVSRRPSSLVIDSKNIAGPAMPDSIEIPPNLTIENFEAGQAEAIGALCRVFCAKRTGEEILPVYLARFYLALQYGLSGGKNKLGQVASSILLNSCDLFRQDLDGCMVLLPHFLSALEHVLPERDLKLNPQPNSSVVELRRASIQILLSMLPLSLHFRDLPIKELIGSNDKPPIMFQTCRPRLMNLLINALQGEADPTNTQMLLGGLFQCVQDSATVEEVEQFTQQSARDTKPSESVAVLLCSDSAASTSAEPEKEPSEPGSLPSSISIESHASYELDSWSESSEYTASDSAYALFVRATYLICHRLISSWKTDLNISLAALEVLSGLARIHFPNQDVSECKRAVKWICDYIVYQCSRPPPNHSKDLHSTIVGAYQCVTTWLLEHPVLLNEKDSVHTVLEVIELGICGSKSRGKSGEVPKLKADKELKPASMRVKDAAESVLTCIMDLVGYFPTLSGPETLSSLLDEESLLQHCNSWSREPVTQEQAVANFRYFVVDNASILALLEQHLGNDQDPQPTVTALIRGPFGKHAWAMQLRHLPRNKSGSKAGTIHTNRPPPLKDTGINFSVKQQYFPDTIRKIPQCQADYSIPSMESVIGNPAISGFDKLSKLMEKQAHFEEAAQSKFNIPDSPNIEVECKQPELCQDFQTARLFLSHFGFLTSDSIKETLTQPLPPLMALDSNQPGFTGQLDFLDSMSNRTYDTVFLFYVKKGQKEAAEILSNVGSSQLVNPHFLEFLLSLGWPVEVAKHIGWTGHARTSWNVKTMSVNGTNPPPIPDRHFIDHGGSLYNGQRQVLYWADATCEIAFVVPSKQYKSEQSCQAKKNENEILEEPVLRSKVNFDSSAKDPDSISTDSESSQTSNSKPRTLSLNLENSTSDGLNVGQARSSGRKFGRSQTHCGYEAKILVVWLESFEDYLIFPTNEILVETTTGLESVLSHRQTEKDAFIIFIHALKNGLYRIKMQGPIGKITLALPLVDGMVVSRRILGMMVRQTTLNLCRRRRLDTDSSVPPHVRRRHKIQEIVERYNLQMKEADFFTSLFTSVQSE